MKTNTLILILGIGILCAPAPINAGPWNYLRNSWLVTKVLGKPAATAVPAEASGVGRELPVILGQPNYTEQTRLPVEEVKSTIWQKIGTFFNFYNWNFFSQRQEPAQEAAAPAQPATMPQEPLQPSFSPEGARQLFERLEKKRKEREAKKPNRQENYEKKIHELVEQKIALKHNLERAEEKAEWNFKGWTAVSNLAGEQHTLIDKQRKQLANADKEKESLISTMRREENEWAKDLREKNSAQEELQKLKRAVEEAYTRDVKQFEQLEQKILSLNRELRDVNAEKENSWQELRQAKQTITRIETELKALVPERDLLNKQVAESRAQKDSLVFKLRDLESKSSEESKKLRNDLDAQKRANEHLSKDLENSRQQASKSRESSLEFNRHLNQKDEELKNIQVAYNLEITEIHQLLSKKRSEIELLLAKLEREEKQKKEVIKTVTNFEHQTSEVLRRLESGNQKLDVMTSRLTGLQSKIASKKSAALTAPQLPVVVLPPKSEVNETLERVEQKLIDFERQKLSPAHSNDAQAMEIYQSTVSGAPALNKSITGEIAESFNELPMTPTSSPELPVNEQLPSSENIMHHMQIDPVYYSAKATKGREYLQQLAQGTLQGQLEQKSQDEHLEIIEAILYRLHQGAAYKGQGFLEGTYVIEDTEDFDLYNTILSYVKKVNTTVTGTIRDPLSHVSFNAFAYPRDASHYVHNKSQHRYYGIDLRHSDKTTFKLPGNHAHLLVGFADKQKRRIFIKPEHKGIFILDGWLGHCGEFMTAQARKNNWFGATVRTVAGLFGYEIWTDDTPLYHKERIPAEFIQQFGLLLAEEQALNNEQKAQLKSDAKKLGIQMLADPRIAQSEAFKQMKAAYEQKYDNVENRSGREVHFNLPQLISLEE